MNVVWSSALRRTEEKRRRKGRSTQRKLQPLGRGLRSEGQYPKRWEAGVNGRDKDESDHVEMWLHEETEGEVMPRDKIIQKIKFWLVVMWLLHLKIICDEKMKRQIYISQRWHHIFLCLLFVSICPKLASSQVRVGFKSLV